MDLATGLSAALVAYNTALNTRSTDNPAYVPVNLALAAGVLATARRAGIGWEDMGLDARRSRRGVGVGLGLAAIAATGLAGSFLHPRTRDLLADDRAADVSGGGLAYRALVRIPIGTALCEELLFRGALQAAWARRLPAPAAVAATNAAFGLWHIGPGLQALRQNRIHGWARISGLAGMVVGTAAGGAFLSALRLRTRSVTAPAVLHATVNSMAMSAAVLAHRFAHRWDSPTAPLRGRTA